MGNSTGKDNARQPKALETFGDRVVIIAGGSSWSVVQLAEVIAAIAACGVDFVGYHGYPPTISEYDRYTAVRALADAVKLKVFVSESGNGTNKAVKEDRTKLPTILDRAEREATQARINASYDLAVSRIPAGLVAVARRRPMCTASGSAYRTTRATFASG